MNQKPSVLVASEVAALLGVKVETVYAYVSRGLLTRLPGEGKESRFEAKEVRELAQRARRSAQPKAEPLVVASALTEVVPGAVRYRGKSAIALALSTSFEGVAQWLWSLEASEHAPFVAPRAAVALARSVQSALPDEALPLERLRVIATVLGSTDALRFDTSPLAVVTTARALIAGMVEGLEKRGAAERPSDSIAQRLFVRLSSLRLQAPRVRALDVALGLCADHGLSPSTLAARVAASQRADPYAVVQTGLGALSGALHGAASLAAEELLAEVEAGAEPSQVVGGRLRRGDRIPGFGHALHTPADPRAGALLQLLSETFARSRAVAAAGEVERIMRERGLPAANIDWALAVLARAAGMPRGASEAIMAVARVAGWVAHALEEYGAPTQFPLCALYVGPPAESDPA